MGPSPDAVSLFVPLAPLVILQQAFLSFQNYPKSSLSRALCLKCSPPKLTAEWLHSTHREVPKVRHVLSPFKGDKPLKPRQSQKLSGLDPQPLPN